MMKNNTRQLVSLIILITLIIGVFPSGVVFADQTLVTDPEYIDPDPSPNTEIHVEVARSVPALGSNLNAPTSYIRLSFKNPPPDGGSHYFRISYCTNGRPYCAANSRDLISINARAYAGSTGEQQTGGLRQINRPASGTNHALPGGVTRSVVNGRYNYLLSVNHIKTTGLTINETAVPFRIRAVGGNGLSDDPRAGFAKSTNPNLPFAIQNRRDNVSGSQHRDNMRVSFRVPCLATNGSPFSDDSFILKWQDADATPSSVPVNTDIRWRLRFIRNGSVQRIISSESKAGAPNTNSSIHQDFMGGNGQSRDVTITKNDYDFRPGDEVEWRWESVRANNGVQLYMPFDDTSLFDGCDEVGFSHQTDFISTTDGTYPSGGIVRPGERYSVLARGWNSGLLDAGDAELIVRNIDRDIIFNEGLTEIYPSKYRRVGFGLHNFYASHLDSENLNNGINSRCSETYDNDNVDRNYACWVWLIKDLPKNTISPTANQDNVASGRFSFRVSESAPNGEQICFDVYIKPRYISGSYFSPSNLCFTVVAPRKPEIRVEESDVHAGAVLSLSSNSDCSAEQIDSVRDDDEIKSNNDNSKGEYAVSATGNISDNFGSNNQSANSTLKFNNAPLPGNYSAICRPDYSKIEPTESVRSANQIGQNDLVNGVMKYNPAGGTLNIYNPITINQGRKTTIIVDGDVRVRGNVSYANSYDSREQIPSFAIIATGDIYIDPTVARIDGLYVANGTFDTCSNPSYSTSSVCSALQLTVNGAVAANKIDLKRKGSADNSIGERFRFLPELYLSQPPGDNNIVNVIRNSQLDLPPVF